PGWWHASEGSPQARRAQAAGEGTRRVAPRDARLDQDLHVRLPKAEGPTWQRGLLPDRSTLAQYGEGLPRSNRRTDRTDPQARRAGSDLLRSYQAHDLS